MSTITTEMGAARRRTPPTPAIPRQGQASQSAPNAAIADAAAQAGNLPERSITMLELLHIRASESVTVAGSLRDRLRVLLDRLRGARAEDADPVSNFPCRSGMLGCLLDIQDGTAARHEEISTLLYELEDHLV